MLRHGRLLSAQWTTVVFILFCAVDLNELVIVVRPESQCAAVGKTIQFNCSTNITSKDPIEWRHRRISDPDRESLKLVYSLGDIIGDYKKRYHVNVLNETGAYNLIISNVTSNDTGEFRCTEKDFATEHKDALLVVKEKPVEQDCSGCPKECETSEQDSKKEDTILGVTVANFIFNIFLAVFLYCHFRRCNRKQTKGQQTEGQQTEDQQTEGQQTEGQQTEGQQTEDQQTEGQQTEGQQTEGSTSTEEDKRSLKNSKMNKKNKKNKKKK